MYIDAVAAAAAAAPQPLPATRGHHVQSPAPLYRCWLVRGTFDHDSPLFPKLLWPFPKDLIAKTRICPTRRVIAHDAWLSKLITLGPNLIRPDVEKTAIHGELGALPVDTYNPVCKVISKV